VGIDYRLELLAAAQTRLEARVKERECDRDMVADALEEIVRRIMALRHDSPDDEFESIANEIDQIARVQSIH
jgi:hypothetical protein